MEGQEAEDGLDVPRDDEHAMDLDEPEPLTRVPETLGEIPTVKFEGWRTINTDGRSTSLLLRRILRPFGAAVALSFFVLFFDASKPCVNLRQGTQHRTTLPGRASEGCVCYCCSQALACVAQTRLFSLTKASVVSALLLACVACPSRETCWSSTRGVGERPCST